MCQTFDDELAHDVILEMTNIESTIESTIPNETLSPQIPMSRTAQLNRQLADLLAKRGDEFNFSGHNDDAENLYYQSLALRPNNPSLLRKLGDLYTTNGVPEDAKLCYQGVIPDSANQRFFDSAKINERIVSAQKSDSTITYRVTNAEQIPLTEPVAHGLPGNYNQFNRTHTDCRGSVVTVSEGGEIWFDGLNILALDRDRQILNEHTKGNLHLAWRAASSRSPEHIKGRVCFLDARSSAIYYHWMLDVLPKLHLLDQAKIALDSIDKFIVRASSGFQKNTLELLGISTDKIIYQDNGAHYTADQLIIPFLKNDLGDKVYSGLGLGAGSWIPGYLKRSLLGERDRVTTQSGKRLYISRADAGSRRIVNEEQIRLILEQFGFQLCQFETMSVPEQAQLMSTAEIVVAPHGAGLTNLAFCQRNTRVLEIFGDYIVPCYWSLSNLTGLDYHYFMAQSISATAYSADAAPGANNVNERRSKDLLIDEEAFYQALSQICRLSSQTITQQSASA